MTRLHVPAGAPVSANRRLSRRTIEAVLTGSALTSSNSKPLTAATTTGGVAHTKGSWAELVASTSSEWTGFLLMPATSNCGNDVDTKTLLDVGVGAGGSEVVIVPNLEVGHQQVTVNGEALSSWFLPVTVPAGSRVALRTQSTRTTQSLSYYVVPLNNMFYRNPPASLVDICANTSTSLGVQLTKPGSANTKGAWTQLTSSCPQPLSAVVISMQGGATSNWNSGTFILVDIGIGAAGSESAVISNFPAVMGSNPESVGFFAPTTQAVSIPAGVRIAARYQYTATWNGQVDVQLVGVPR